MQTNIVIENVLENDKESFFGWRVGGLRGRSGRQDWKSSLGPDCVQPRSEERRVRKECRSRWSPYH